MKTLIIVSKCLRVTKLEEGGKWFEFHFRGVCAGEVLKKVYLNCPGDMDVQKGKEYLMYVGILSFQMGVLKGSILKIKDLADCWDQS